METVFTDTGVLLDLLVNHQAHSVAAAELFTLADLGRVKICIASSAISQLAMFLSRQYKPNQVKKKLTKLKTLFTVLPVTDKAIGLALASGIQDLDNAIQLYAATEHGIEVFLTRQLKVYKKSGMAVLTPAQFLKTNFE